MRDCMKTLKALRHAAADDIKKYMRGLSNSISLEPTYNYAKGLIEQARKQHIHLTRIIQSYERTEV